MQVALQITKQLAEFIAGLDFSSIPTETAHQVKLAFLDGIGCAFYGLSTPWGAIVADLAKERGQRPEATVIGAGFAADLEYAVMANGTLIHSFDFDDYHNAKLHPAAAVSPAALAVAEKDGLSGQQLLIALVAGYETMIRISLGTGPNASRLRGWHLTGTCGTFGAAAAAAKLKEFDANLTQNALGLAGTQSSGLWAFNADGAMSKRLHPGRAAQSGILAIMLAGKGFTGPGQILETVDGGFCRATSDDYHLEIIVDGLGEYFEAGRVCIKPYACCGSIHSAIDAALALRRENKIEPGQIDHVNVYGSNVVKVQTGWDYHPTTVLQAQMSIKYSVAAALIDGQVLISQFSEEKIRDEQMIALANLIKFIVDPEMDALYPKKFCNEVEVVLKDGISHRCRVDDPKGSPMCPLTDDEVFSKFRDLANIAGKSAQADAIIDRVMRLEELKDVRDLMALLR